MPEPCAPNRAWSFEPVFQTNHPTETVIRSHIRIEDEKLPLLATAIHNGHWLPPQLSQISGITDAQRLREEDPHTGKIAALFPNYVVLESSRFAVDLNRPLQKSVYLNPSDCWGLQARNAPLPEAVLKKLHQDYDSWHRLMEYQIQRLLGEHPKLLVLDLHSYNHRRGGPEAEPAPQIQNPDIIIGRSNLSPTHHPAAQALRELLNGQTWQGKSLDCRLDIKFTGGDFPRWVNLLEPARVVCLAVEFKKTLMDEWTAQLDDVAFEELILLFYHQVSRWLKEFYDIQIPLEPHFCTPRDNFC